MFARDVSIHLKSNMLSDYTRTFEKDVLPLLRKQSGFKDEITFSSPGGTDVTAISLWDNKANAEAYNSNAYPEVLKTLARIIGRGKGAVIGAVVGAAAGTGIQAVTKRAPVQLRAESTLSFRLEAPLTLQRGQSVGSNSSQDSSSLDRPVLKRRFGNLPPDTNPAPR